VHHELTVY